MLLDFKNNLRVWLDSNVSKKQYYEIYNRAEEYLGISASVKDKDFTSQRNIPKTRRIVWLQLIQEYKPTATMEDIFPSVTVL